MSDYHRLKEVFQSALERTPHERAAFLDAACAGDAALRREVAEMLASYDEAETFLEAFPAAAAAEFAAQEAKQEAEEVMTGKRVGPYQLVREIGRGGMGAVYLATRDDEFRQQVAIKLIKRGMDTDFVVRRFRHERQILAALKHPNIARLYDGGTTDDGLPYFVMEYIEGEPINAYCDRRRLSTEGRLKLFREVCAAVQYAHQNLVVHRDLKPSNILITASQGKEGGTPKLLDFGIAKLLGPQEAGEATEATATAVWLMTPEYASPEQARGLAVTTASDVYSLGVILYELLTGHRPYRLHQRLPHEVLRIICEEEPARPSSVVSRVEAFTGGAGKAALTPESVSRTREGQPEKLRRRLRGDLDNIVLMALRKEPERRYSSAEQLSEDIRRHLTGLPVIAREDTLSYRTGKFIQRHKAGVAVAAAMLLMLIAGVAAVLWQARVARSERAKAEQRFNEVRSLANSFLFEFHDAIEKLPGSTPARALVVKRAVEYLDRLAHESGGDLSLQRELATAYQRVGNIQGNSYFANLGDTAGAIESYRKALAIREALAAAAPRGVEARLELAASHSSIGDLRLFEHDFAQAAESYRRALRLLEGLAAEEPNSPRVRDALAASYENLSEVMWQTGETAAGFETYRKALEIREARAAEEPHNPQTNRRLASSLDTLATRLVNTAAKSEAVADARRALAIFTALAAEPGNAQARRELAVCHNHLGDILWATGDVRGELESYRQSLAIRQELAAADPANIQLRHDLGVAHGNFGYALAQTGDAAGIEACRKAVLIFESLVSSDPANIRAQRDVAAYTKWTGDAHSFLAAHARTPAAARLEHWRQAREWYQRSLKLTLEMCERGTLRGDDAGSIEEIKAALIKCEAALR